MACYVFGHMRAHELLAIRPDAETYVQCYLGIAACRDEESLRMVHNMMKMDVGVEPSTRLNNALMIAFASIGDADRALDFWVDITNSREGPSYRSLEIVFRVCEGLDFGESTAKEVWGMMRRMDVEVTAEVADAYVGALGGQVLKDEAMQLIENMEKELGLVPSYMTLGIFYNALPGDKNKASVKSWAEANFPDQWAELEKVPMVKHKEDGYLMFDLERPWRA